MADDFDKIDQRRNDLQGEAPKRPTRPTRSAPAVAPPKLDRDKASEAQLMKALETGNFSGLDLRGDFSNYHSLAHLRDRDGLVTAKQLITPDALKRHHDHLTGISSLPPLEKLDDLAARKQQEAERRDVLRRNDVQFAQKLRMGVNVSNANLSGVDLSNTDFQGDSPNYHGKYNFSGAKLGGANLERANLNTHNFEGADLTGATLRNTLMEDAHLKNANVKDANMQNINLRDANLEGVALNQAKNVAPELLNPPVKKIKMGKKRGFFGGRR